MSLSPQLRVQHENLLDARFREIYNDRFSLNPTYYDKIFQVKDSNRAYELYSSESGLEYPVETPEYGQSPEDGKIQGFDLTLTPVKFTKTTKVSNEAIEDDLYSVLDKQAAALGKVMKQFPDYSAADMLKRGFEVTDSEGRPMLAADGVRHFSTKHLKNPQESSVLYSNASASGLPLTEENLNTGIIALENQLDERGKLINLSADLLVVPPALKKQALEITGSTMRSGTADNDLNVFNNKECEAYYGGSLKVIVWKELGAASRNGSDTAWYLLDKENHQMIFQWRVRPTVAPVKYTGYKSDSYIWFARQRFAFGMVDWRGVWASKGDGQSYSN